MCPACLRDTTKRSVFCPRSTRAPWHACGWCLTRWRLTSHSTPYRTSAAPAPPRRAPRASLLRRLEAWWYDVPERLELRRSRKTATWSWPFSEPAWYAGLRQLSRATWRQRTKDIVRAAGQLGATYDDGIEHRAVYGGPLATWDLGRQAVDDELGPLR